MHDEGRQIFHAAEPRRLLEGREQFAQGEAVVTLFCISILRSARAEHAQESLAVQRRPAFPVGEAVFEHEVLPFLEHGGRTVPVERVLENDEVVRGEELLFVLHVELKIVVPLVQVVERHPVEPAHGVRQRPLHARTVKRRVGEEDQRRVWERTRGHCLNAKREMRNAKVRQHVRRIPAAGVVTKVGMRVRGSP